MSSNTNTNTNTTAVKARLDNGETRRFALPPTASWTDLRDKLAGVFGLDKSPFTVNYTDEDGDNVVVSTDGEVAELLNFNKTVRLNVVPSSSASASSTPATPATPAATAESESDSEEEADEEESEPELVSAEPADEPTTEPATTTEPASTSETAVPTPAAPAKPASTSEIAVPTPAAPAKHVYPEIIIEDLDDNDEPISYQAKGKGRLVDDAVPAQAAASTATSSAASPSPSTTTTAPKRTSSDVRADLERLSQVFNERNQDLFEQFGALNKEIVALATQELAEAHRKWAEERNKVWEQRRQEWIKARGEAIERRRKEAAAQAATQEQRRKEWIERQQRQQHHCGRYASVPQLSSLLPPRPIATMTTTRIRTTSTFTPSLAATALRLTTSTISLVASSSPSKLALLPSLQKLCTENF